MYNRSTQISLLNELLVKELKENYIFASNQFQIYSFDENLPESVESLTKAAGKTLFRKHALAFALRKDGSFLYFSNKDFPLGKFTDTEALKFLIDNTEKGISEGSFNFRIDGYEFLGVYKYHSDWDAYLIRAEDEDSFYAESRKIFRKIIIFIIGVTLFSMIIGIWVFKRLLRYIDYITQQIMKMQENQELSIVDLKGAPNDDITYLGASFNQLSSSITTLMGIFRKFVTDDIAKKAYEEKQIRLEGAKSELAILFSDIKGFTFMTETLGNDIINLLNLHYDQAIRYVAEDNGVVASIIGDALLAVYGTMGDNENKSLQAIHSAYSIQDVAMRLRRNMQAKKENIVGRKGALTSRQEKVYKAVLIEVGVGIDKGEVFYGNIGSYVRMTNTVIGDNVNSASRLEGLTRIYKIPVIVSDSVREEAEADSANLYYFLEIDQVQVKGKTYGKRIFWPIKKEVIDPDMENSINKFKQGLQLYYDGEWDEALPLMKAVGLPLAEVFIERMLPGQIPSDWSGVWAMTSK
ncbi:MAG: adenylate/guanylate cyclase domain-containing protein [Spirochaetales bacterium]|nr:adenylate/guanylate cyclase domain-containing protein [Spirochaetales bacterium]